jgi:lysozyme
MRVIKKRNYNTWYDKLLNKLFTWQSGVMVLTVGLMAGLPSGVTDGKLKVLPSTVEVEIPIKFGAHGIDISHHNGDIDWDKVTSNNAHRSAVKFCFIKATEGTNLVDNRFSEHWSELRKRKISRGAYHFFNNKSDPSLQALNFILQVKLEHGDLPPVIDFENDVFGKKNKLRLARNIAIFIDLVENHYGVKPIIYTNKHLYKQYIEEDYSEYPIWISQYNIDRLDGYNDDHLAFWQYSMKGKVEGIESAVDFNVFLGEEVDFQKLLLP